MNTNRKRKGIALAALGLALALTAGMALAQPAPGPRAGAVLRRALASLDLTADQQTKVQAILEASRSDFQAARTEGRNGREALKAALAKPTPDPKEVGEAFLKLDANRKAVRSQMEGVKTRVDAVLTPEQRAKLDGFLAAVRGRGRGGPGGPGAGHGAGRFR